MKKLSIFCLFLSLCLAAAARPLTRSEAFEAASAVLPFSLVSDFSDDGGIKPYYVFSKGKGLGFVIASGDDSLTPVLGYTEQGDFAYDELPIQLRQMLDGWAETISLVQQTEAPLVPPLRGDDHADSANLVKLAKSKIRRAQAKDVAPLVETHWHQSSPYNDICPVMDNGQHALTGCVATAGAQVIYYFRKDNPAETLYDTPTYGYGTPVTVSIPKGTAIEYNKMLRQGHGSKEQDAAVAMLMYVTGTSTWLTYGSSTSGQVSDLGKTLSGQFNISNECLYKSSFSQANWEKRILDNLNSKRPMVYSGVHPQNGGHAVVLDGYQASTNLFHFNFGWGGQGDGYFTVDDETGMSGFCSAQSMLSMPTPKKPNISGEMSVSPFYQNADCPIEITVKNSGTLDLTNISVYCSTSATMPATPSFTDKTTVVESGSSATITASYKPTSAKAVNIWLCDENKNVLDKQTVEVQPSVAYIHLNDIDIDASGETETFAGIDFRKVNNTTINVTMSLTNGEGGTFAQPTIRCTVEKLDAAAMTWGSAYQKIVQEEAFEPGETKDVVFTIENVKPDTYYRAYLYKKVRAGEVTDAIYDTPDSIVYFVVEKPNLAVTVSGRHAKVTGNWNAEAFTALPLTAAVTSFDMTEVVGLNSKPEAPNPNALYFTDADVEGSNIVKGGACQELVVSNAYDFCTPSAFTAAKAKLVLADAVPGEYKDVFVPFAADAPDGMQVRHITALNSSAVVCEKMRYIPAFTPILYMCGRAGEVSISAENVTITTDTTFTSAVLYGSTTTVLTDGTQYLLGASGTGVPTFLKTDQGTEMAAFRTAVFGTSKSGHRALPSLTIDRAYMELSTTIAEAWALIDEEAVTPIHTQSPIDELMKAIAEAEAFFTDDNATAKDEITAAITKLTAAIKTFKDSPAEIGAVKADSRKTSTAIYNLAGQKVNADYRGIIIRNGKRIKQ